MLSKKRIARRRTQQYAYDHSEAGRARRQRYNIGAAGKARNDRMRVKRRNEPKYAEYRAKKLVDDRRNHFFRYSRLLDEKMIRYPWLRNNYSASQIFTRISGIRMDKHGVLSQIDFSQPRTKKRTEEIVSSESALDTFSRITAISLSGGR